MACFAQFRSGQRGWTDEDIKQLIEHYYGGKLEKDGHYSHLGKDDNSSQK